MHDGQLQRAAEVAAAWFGGGCRVVTPWPVSGFSGATLTRVESHQGTFVLKAFASATSRERAGWIQRLVEHVAAAGVREVSPPVATPRGDTLVSDASGRLWEMTRFISGTALDTPTPAQAAAALAVVARLHRAAATVPGEAPAVAMPAAVVTRREQAHRLADRPWRDRRFVVAGRAEDRPLLARWDRAIAAWNLASGERALAAVREFVCDPLPVRPVVRDLWSAHVLFAPGGATVAGIIDFHAAARDTPATDLARLLASWWPTARKEEQRERWDAALAAYGRVRPLPAAERRLVPFLAATGVVFGLDNWFRWTLEERRTFPSARAVEARVDALLAALPAALESLAVGRNWAV